MLRVPAVVLASALIVAPLGARAADLVVWWDKGFYPQEDEAVHEIVAAFEQETGKQVELALFPGDALAGKLEAAIEAGRPPDFAFGCRVAGPNRPVGGRRPAGGSLRRCWGLLEPVRSGCARLGHLAPVHYWDTVIR